MATDTSLTLWLWHITDSTWQPSVAQYIDKMSVNMSTNSIYLTDAWLTDALLHKIQVFTQITDHSSTKYQLSVHVFIFVGNKKLMQILIIIFYLLWAVSAEVTIALLMLPDQISNVSSHFHIMTGHDVQTFHQHVLTSFHEVIVKLKLATDVAIPMRLTFHLWWPRSLV